MTKKKEKKSPKMSGRAIAELLIKIFFLTVELAYFVLIIAG